MTKIKNEEFLWLADKLTNAEYRFAKSMPKNPHWYTLRRQWEHDDEYLHSKYLIDKYGYEKWYWYRKYICFDVNEYFYWEMQDGEGQPHLINRKKNEKSAPYDCISNWYDELFVDDVYKQQDKELLDLIGYKKGDTVLDIGCGTGLFIDYTKIPASGYIGVDPSSKMLFTLNNKHPDHKTINTKFESFYVNEKFDLILMLYGVASYVDADALERVKFFLNDGGKAFLMFYKEEYYPETYKKTGIELCSEKTLAKDINFGTKYQLWDYDIVEVTK